MNVPEVLKNQPLYCVVIFLSLLTGLVYYVIVNRKKETFTSGVFVFCFSGTASILASAGICCLLSKLFSTEKYAYNTVFSIFYAIITFPVFVFILQKASYKPFDLSPYLNPVVLSSFLSRIACLKEGCCDGSIHAVKIEMALLLLLFIYNTIKKNLSFEAFLLCYSLWRFIADFFKIAYNFERLGPLTVVQYCAAVVILLSILALLYKRRQKNEKK